MKIFSKLYDKVMRWSVHRHALWYLGGLSFAESSFFPVPPDVMLAPMSLARPARAYQFAMVTTLASVSGGILGYLVGRLAFGIVEPWIVAWQYSDALEYAQQWFNDYGFWAIFLAGFSPIPYKIFTVTAGVFGVSIPVFLIASTVGRAGRFLLVGALVGWGGPAIQPFIEKYLGWLTLAFVALLILGFVVLGQLGK